MTFDDRILNGLGVLAAVVRSGSFALAGKSLNMSQSGVSRAIARLEARLGVRLLERTTRTVMLSEEGRRLYEQIVPLLAGLEEAAASVATAKDTVRGTLRVNMDPFIAQLMLGPQLSRFLKRFPGLKLELIARDRLGDLVAEGFDLAIRFGEPRPSTLVARKLLDTRVLTVASPVYLKKAGRPSLPSQLEEGNLRIDFAVASRRTEAAIGAGNDTRAPDQPGKANDPLRNQIGMLDVIGRSIDDAWQQDLVGR